MFQNNNYFWGFEDFVTFSHTILDYAELKITQQLYTMREIKNIGMALFKKGGLWELYMIVGVALSKQEYPSQTEILGICFHYINNNECFHFSNPSAGVKVDLEWPEYFNYRRLFLTIDDTNEVKTRRFFPMQRSYEYFNVIYYKSLHCDSYTNEMTSNDVDNSTTLTLDISMSSPKQPSFNQIYNISAESNNISVAGNVSTSQAATVSAIELLSSTQQAMKNLHDGGNHFTTTEQAAIIDASTEDLVTAAESVMEDMTAETSMEDAADGSVTTQRTQ